MKIRYFLIIISIIFFVYILGNMISGFFKMKPHLDNLFNNGENLENYQQLTDSIFVFKSINNDVVKFNINKKLIIHFWSLNNGICLDELPDIEKYIQQNSSTAMNTVIVADDSIFRIKNFILKNKIKFPIYHFDTIDLPLKYRNIIYPYTIIVDGDSLSKSFLSKKELLINEIKK